MVAVPVVVCVPVFFRMVMFVLMLTTVVMTVVVPGFCVTSVSTMFGVVAVEDRRFDLDTFDAHVVSESVHESTRVLDGDVDDAFVVDSHLAVGVSEFVSELRRLRRRESVYTDGKSLDCFECDNDRSLTVVHDIPVTQTAVDDDADIATFLGLRTDTRPAGVSTRKDDAFDLSFRFRVFDVSVVGVTD